MSDFKKKLMRINHWRNDTDGGQKRNYWT